jgi:hypothetical protein
MATKRSHAAQVRAARQHQHQQGDVTLERIAALPAAARKPAGRVLAHGEVTGHAHRLTDSSDGLLVEIGGQLYLSVGAGGAEIAHEEHGAVKLEPGDYRVGRIQEYDHFAEEARRVAD